MYQHYLNCAMLSKIEYATRIEMMERILGAHKVVLWDEVAPGRHASRAVRGHICSY